jgi:hypothetical protein
VSSIEKTAAIGSITGRQAHATRPLKRFLQLVIRNKTWLGFVGTAFVVYAGWAGRHERNITAEDGLGYILGIVGASMMAALLIYPLRKRLRSLRILGSTRHWFMAHMVLGIAGPVLILYHSNFAVSSLNSQVALFCTLLVAGSGIIGRYLYAQIHRGLYGEKTNLRSLVNDMQHSLEQITASSPVLAGFQEQLAAFDKSVLEPPENLFRSTIRPFSFAFSTRWAYLRMSWKLRRAGAHASASSKSFSAHEKRLVIAARRALGQHLKQVRKVAHLNFFDRLFSLWHILHLPFFFMLVISAIVHILAVHMY